MAFVHKMKINLEEGEGFEEGLITPLEMITPEDRAAYKEEYITHLMRAYGMTETQAHLHIYFAEDLEP